MQPAARHGQGDAGVLNPCARPCIKSPIAQGDDLEEGEEGYYSSSSEGGTIDEHIAGWEMGEAGESAPGCGIVWCPKTYCNGTSRKYERGDQQRLGGKSWCTTCWTPSRLPPRIKRTKKKETACFFLKWKKEHKHHATLDTIPIGDMDPRKSRKFLKWKKEHKFHAILDTTPIGDMDPRKSHKFKLPGLEELMS